jgi:S-adenosylhomocysteine hydrolase
LNMILDDGGDLTNIVHQKYPELLAGMWFMPDSNFVFVFQLPSKKKKHCAILRVLQNFLFLHMSGDDN